METNYEESYRRIMEYQNEEHLRNQKKIRWGIRCVILIPMIFLMLMFSMDSSKVVFLVLWIVSYNFCLSDLCGIYGLYIAGASDRAWN